MEAWKLHIASIRNDVIKGFGRQVLRALTPFVYVSIRRRLKRYVNEQFRLRKCYGIERETSITSWGPGVQQSVDQASRGCRNVRYAFTSGSTSGPKRIPYTPKRLRIIKRASFEAILQATRAYAIKYPTLFVLTAMRSDNSLSSLLLQGRAKIPFLGGLIIPSRYLWDPRLFSLVEAYGPTAVRLSLLVLSNPGILYATNPSTIASFFNTLEQDWMGSSRLLRELATDPNAIDPQPIKILRRVLARGWRARIRLVASASELPRLQDMVPALQCYCCWDGGYVAPFFEIIQRYLPPDRFLRLSMYSMSTECLQTQTYFVGKTPYYLPIAPCVLYEFLPEHPEDDPECLLAACDLEVGCSYSMVVSDRYGLSRYQTNDIFSCLGKIGGLPDLRFLRRRGLTYSFTGEKITGQQVETVIAELQRLHPLLCEFGAQMTLIPALPDRVSNCGFPHYRLVIAHTGLAPPPISTAQLCTDFDRLLAVENIEFAAKRNSARLGPSRALLINYDQLAHFLNPSEDRGERGWDSQFKLMPLYTKRWDELGLPALEHVR
jgi:hypothetical protein